MSEATIADRPKLPGERRQIRAVVSALIVLTIGAMLVGGEHAPVLPAFLPVCVTLWVAADLLTCYFIFSQFSTSGVVAFLFIGAAYGTTGLLSIIYLARFPGLFLPLNLSSGDQQVSVYMWTIWHVAFPLLIGAYLLVDPSFKRRLSPHARPGALRMALAIILLTAFFFAVTILLSRGILPVFILHGHFRALFGNVAFGLFILSATGVAVGLRQTNHNQFQRWLLVAVFGCALDALLNGITPARYTWTWYFGKLETLLTSSLVLFALLGEVASLYKRLSNLSMLDPLTGVRNRRGLQEMLQYAVDSARRQRSPFGLLVIDIDHFKLYNDRYGHAAGDGVLRQVANALNAALMRSTDSLARYGGEEFVVLLPAADAASAASTAENLRAQVQSLCIPHADSTFMHVTVSIGSKGGLVPANMTTGELFDLADDALYAAKARGRNCVESSRSVDTDNSPPLKAVA